MWSPTVWYGPKLNLSRVSTDSLPPGTYSPGKQEEQNSGAVCLEERESVRDDSAVLFCAQGQAWQTGAAERVPTRLVVGLVCQIMEASNI